MTLRHIYDLSYEIFAKCLEINDNNESITMVFNSKRLRKKRIIEKR